VLSAETYRDIDSYAYLQAADVQWHTAQPLDKKFAAGSA